MGLIRPDGEVDKTSLFALSAVYAGLLFDELCDFYQDYSMVKDDLDQLFSAAETAEGGSAATPSLPGHLQTVMSCT